MKARPKRMNYGVSPDHQSQYKALILDAENGRRWHLPLVFSLVSEEWWPCKSYPSPLVISQNGSYLILKHKVEKIFLYKGHLGVSSSTWLMPVVRTVTQKEQGFHAASR